MGSPSHEIEDWDEPSNGPKITPQDEIVSSYLDNRSAIFRDLVKVKSDVWNDPQAAAYFDGLRRKVDSPKVNDHLAFYLSICKIGDEIDAASGGGLSLQNSHAQVLDLGTAPGGFTSSVLKRNQDAYICALTLPCKLGGHMIMHYKDSRISGSYPTDDSQLILVMQRIKSGGTLIMTFHSLRAYDTIKILTKRMALSFPVIDEDENEDTKELSNEPELAEAVLGILDRFADRVIELGEPISQIQKEALAAPPKSRRGQQNWDKPIAAEGSTTATHSTVVAADDSEEDVNDAGDPDDATAAPVSDKVLDSDASSLRDSA